MKDQVRVACVQFPIKSAVAEEEGKEKNVAYIVEKIKELGADHDLVVFPELATHGYITLKGYDPKFRFEYWKTAEPVAKSPSVARIADATAEAHCAAAFGFLEKAEVKFEMFNTALILEKGKLLGANRKVHIPVEENHYFTPGPEQAVFTTHAGILGVAICYDMLFPETYRVLALKGAEILIAIANMADLGNLKRIGETLPVARAVENQAHFIFCNGTGDLTYRNHTLHLFGESRIVNAYGEVVARAKGDKEEVVSAVLTQAELELGSSLFPIFRDRSTPAYGPIVKPLA